MCNVSVVRLNDRLIGQLIKCDVAKQKTGRQRRLIFLNPAKVVPGLTQVGGLSLASTEVDNLPVPIMVYLIRNYICGITK
jgi:hypothetical protein